MKFAKAFILALGFLLFVGPVLAGDRNFKVGIEIRYANFSFEPHRLEVDSGSETKQASNIIKPTMVTYSPAVAPELTFFNRIKIRAGASMDIVMSMANKDKIFESCGFCGHEHKALYYDVIVNKKPDLGIFGEGEIVVNKTVSFLGGYGSSENDLIFWFVFDDEGDFNDVEPSVPLGKMRNEKKYFGLRLKVPSNGTSFLFTGGPVNFKYFLPDQSQGLPIKMMLKNSFFIGISANYTFGW
jgi:hypothetical protein